MIHNTTCDTCGCPMAVKYTTEDIISMEAMKIDWKAIQGRCDACQEKVLIDHGYIKIEKPKATAKPLSGDQVRERLPIAKLTGARPRPDDGAEYLSPEQFLPL